LIEVDPDRFEFELPIWFVTIAADAGAEGPVALADPRFTLPVTRNAAGEKCWPVFTDKDLAERFAVEKGIAHPILTTIATEQEFLTLCDELEAVGHSRILFDPRGVQAFQSQTICQVRDAIRRSLRL
jgi:hypothetical protein